MPHRAHNAHGATRQYLAGTTFRANLSRGIYARLLVVTKFCGRRPDDVKQQKEHPPGGPSGHAQKSDNPGGCRTTLGERPSPHSSGSKCCGDEKAESRGGEAEGEHDDASRLQ